MRYKVKTRQNLRKKKIKLGTKIIILKERPHLGAAVGAGDDVASAALVAKAQQIGQQALDVQAPLLTLDVQHLPAKRKDVRNQFPEACPR